ncbi:SGNH/GDSL hydrolase family protein [Rhizobium sp. XQZ8]|uniref:SGNH/GDSL hydrolase family protein n=1 Tax=Rhizobium populisoli TaxID=2859785 RepID=UPI001C932203|nr:SGNH/GDSL hydrolase family protein [Rhizobium populisoli]MBW6422029.1 SGNH/GDSL hydrolase family protein [Rhizobium populisoli]
MKQILAFGDSLTWGANPQGGRYAFEDRWPSALEAAFNDVRVIAEGLPGRTTCFDDRTANIDRNGANILPILLASHSPLDLVVFMLGTNDLKPHVCGTAEGSAEGIERLVEIVTTFDYGKGRPAPEIVIVSPPHFRQPAPPMTTLMEGLEIDKSLLLAPLYKAVANKRKCLFFDAAGIAEASLVDGIHLDAANTRIIGTAIAEVLKKTDLI